MDIFSAENSSIYDHEIIDIDGNLVKLDKFKGKPILLINTASRCGFTPQYEGLQELFIKYKKTDLTIIATTSNSFNQEYNSAEDIKKICLVNYNIGFITSSPMNVKGHDAHPLYLWINDKYGKKPKWNFYKYLFNRDGKLIDSWSSMTKPNNNKIINKINKLI
jgi:glutathione peroxidase